MGMGVQRRSAMPGLLAGIGLFMALCSAALFIWAPWAYRHGTLSIDTALMKVVPAGLLAGFAAVFVIFVRTLVAWRLRQRSGVWLARVGFVVALAAIAYPISELQKGARLPHIHDITTDTRDPPQFVDIAPVRQTAPNGEIYGGEKVARQQALAYPDIEPIRLAMPPSQAFAKARAAAATLGWKIVAAAPDSGRIEATDFTVWFRFPLDIVIRVRADGEGGSRVDVRSVSRIGDADRGANAARIREFRARLG